MDRLSVRVPSDTLDAIEEYADANDLQRSPAARELIQSALADERGPDVDERVQRVRDEYEARIADLETELSRCRNARRLLIERQEEHTSLVEATEQQASLAEQRADAGITTRARWWLFGRRDDER